MLSSSVGGISTPSPLAKSLVDSFDGAFFLFERPELPNEPLSSVSRIVPRSLLVILTEERFELDVRKRSLRALFPSPMMPVTELLYMNGTRQRIERTA